MISLLVVLVETAHGMEEMRWMSLTKGTADAESCEGESRELHF
jgi:hypothetical protein